MCEPRIYVADLAAYNNGILHGVWIDATSDIEDIKQQVQAMLKASPIGDAEEYAIHDYEGYDGYSLSEYEGLDTAHEIACFIGAHGKVGAELLDHYGGDLEVAWREIEENYSGCYKSLAEFAENLTEETVQIPPALQYYIDHDRMAADMEMSGEVFTVRTGFEEVHVFWSR